MTPLLRFASAASLAVLAGWACALSPASHPPSTIPTEPPMASSEATALLSATPTTSVASTASLPTELPPLPTVPDPQAAIYELYDTYGGCRLPCWWTITPGTTTWKEATRSFAQYGDFVNLEEASDAGRYIAYFPPRNTSVDYWVSSQLTVSGGIVSTISLDPEVAMWSGFSPTYLLQTFGLPNSLLANGQASILLFDDLGIIASFRMAPHSETPTDSSCFDGYGPFLLTTPQQALILVSSLSDFAGGGFSSLSPSSAILQGDKFCIILNTQP
jgi:hypothetical protein